MVVVVIPVEILKRRPEPELESFSHVEKYKGLFAFAMLFLLRVFILWFLSNISTAVREVPAVEKPLSCFNCFN